MDSKEHWDKIFSTKQTGEMSWTQTNASCSLELMRLAGAGTDSSLIDVGSGESVLIGQLLQQGYRNLTVLDISRAGIERAKKKLGKMADSANWLVSDVLRADFSPHSFDLWHDRAVFHFLTEVKDRAAYVSQLKRALKPGGHAIVATFSMSGPEKCSGLSVMRYSCESLQSEFASVGFELIKCVEETHATPWGKPQDFVYNLFRRLD